MTEPSIVSEATRAHEARLIAGNTEQNPFGSPLESPRDSDTIDALDFEAGASIDLDDVVGPDVRAATVVAPPTKREREAEWMRTALETPDLSDIPMADLRVLANRMFRLLDSDAPPLEAAERYSAAVEEIEERGRQQAVRGLADKRRQVFKDSAFSSRFELFVDGSLGAYLRYSLTGGLLTLRVLVEMPGFEARGLTPVLLRHAMLHAHKRRLGVVPGCAAAKAFLEQNPQYRTLARMPSS